MVCGDGRHFLAAWLTLKPDVLKTFLDVGGVSGARGAAACQHPLVLAEPLSIDTGALTATMKIKRKVVIDRYREVVEKMYAD